MEKTAVEFLSETFGKHFGTGWLVDETIKKEIEQAKEMERQQIIDARKDIYTTGELTAEQYYIKKYKQQ
jgi:hypothetical protein